MNEACSTYRGTFRPADLVCDELKTTVAQPPLRAPPAGGGFAKLFLLTIESTPRFGVSGPEVREPLAAVVSRSGCKFSLI
jgi:hypothetical protein